MRLLLDTHAFLWWLFDDPQLSTTSRDCIADPGNEILVSAASAWEISTKYRLGKLPAVHELVRDMSAWVTQAGFRSLPVEIVHAIRAGNWPQAHRDPFDRMLAAQSEIEDLPLVSCDAMMSVFGVRTVW